MIIKTKKLPLGLTSFELALWSISSAVCILSHFISGDGSTLSLAASLVGAAALIFVSKGYVAGQLLTVVFAVLYGIVSYQQRYYGEMITYLGMSAPMAVAATVSWIRHPSKNAREVEIAKLTHSKAVILAVLTVAVTAAFYFILRTLGTAELFVGTISVATSFAAASLTFLRSPYYALMYSANDIVLIILWVIAAVSDISYLSMVACFAMFLANDIYGFVNWQRMQKSQSKNN